MQHYMALSKDKQAIAIRAKPDETNFSYMSRLAGYILRIRHSVTGHLVHCIAMQHYYDSLTQLGCVKVL